jgi:3-deoxy-D-manno-octulosonate 8-phosphate phosphatase (KDO 8-P phosphatase)
MQVRLRRCNLARIKLLILDVDGVLTDGGLPYSATGNEIKVFNVQDGAAIRAWQAVGGLAAIISGRQSPAVDGRAKDLGIAYVHQSVAQKLPVYEALCRQLGVKDEEVCMIGDDLPDLGPMSRCGCPIAVANAVPLVKRAACHVTQRHGGDGAVAEAVRRLLRRNETSEKTG